MCFPKHIAHTMSASRPGPYGCPAVFCLIQEQYTINSNTNIYDSQKINPFLKTFFEILCGQMPYLSYIWPLSPKYAPCFYGPNPLPWNHGQYSLTPIFGSFRFYNRKGEYHVSFMGKDLQRQSYASGYLYRRQQCRHPHPQGLQGAG